MATKPTAKKQPFVIEPLNWVAPGTTDDKVEKRADDAKQPAQSKESQD
ncbi:hypothetical protein [Pollutimonas harenae]|uniref:Uncharacterized protein n=1 Tax=Pollutimonas harenae TaxID=657015 RepID=A0A853H4K2_9BURK|nr:hypothetical protein [Pollutimonas harenae]NYT86105.1 hypothetical protein [Pollutimonas harenae]